MKADLLISLRMSLTVSLMVLLFISRVVAQDGWAVNYNSKSVCTLKGSALTMECTYTPPSNHSVQKPFWTKELVTSGSEHPDLLDDPEYRGRVQYLGDEHRDCSLRFKTVRETDQSKYYFTFITNQTGGKYQGAGGVDLSVTDLQVEVPERVIEGDNVTLTCKPICSLTVRPTFTWYRNGSSLSSSNDSLHLQPVSSDNKDRYHCGVLGQNSPEVTLNIRYGPKSISVSISPSGEIVEGSSVTLTCSSDANPPVQNYTWFKGTSSVGKGETYTMKKISSVDSGEYKCRSSNEHGEKFSEALTLNVLYPPKSVSVSISPSGEIVEGSSVTLTCSSDANPPVEYNWIKGTSSVGKGETYTMKEISSVDSGQYTCRSSNEHGEKLSEAVTLNVLYPPRNVRATSIRAPDSKSETLTCSSDANPPVQNYNWFKEGGSSPVGSGHSYMALQSGSYYCVAQNEHGSQKSAAVTVKVNPNNILVVVTGVVVGLGVVVAGAVFFYCRHVRKSKQQHLARVGDLDY
uniref:Ig-like domain-containing protein n=1 Tax=Pygocentrus nattereri TaxID=42514 RepID=A0A3B4DTK6_PYGNA